MYTSLLAPLTELLHQKKFKQSKYTTFYGYCNNILR